MREAIFAIVAVTLITVGIVWGGLYVIREAERMQRDVKLLRRRFVFLGTLYACSASWGAYQVIAGRQSPLALIGIAVAGGVGWLLIRGAAKAKIPAR